MEHSTEGLAVLNNYEKCHLLNQMTGKSLEHCDRALNSCNFVIETAHEMLTVEGMNFPLGDQIEVYDREIERSILIRDTHLLLVQECKLKNPFECNPRTDEYWGLEAVQWQHKANLEEFYIGLARSGRDRKLKAYADLHGISSKRAVSNYNTI